MRGTRWLLLVAIAAILGGVAVKYRASKKFQRDQAIPKPDALSVDLNSSAMHWQYRDKDHKTGRIMADIDAESMQQVKDSSRVDLTHVTMKLYNKESEKYDLVKSAAASFSAGDHHLYSEGEVEITIGVPVEGQPERQLVSIKSSGVTFDTVSNQADTDRPSSFTFQNGTGKSTGAYYDPATHELLLKRDAEVDWQPVGPNAKPMKIEAATLSYHEATSEIWLKPWGRMTRENTVVEGTDAVLHLDNRKIRRVDAIHAHGTDDYPNRKLRYAADQLSVDFDDNGKAQKIVGQNNAQLTSTSETSETNVAANRVELTFDLQADDGDDTENTDRVLSQVNATGNAVVTSKPLPAPGRQLSETHILRSEAFDMNMRPGGREIATVVTKAPGNLPASLEFIPNQPVQHHRTLDGKDMVIAYGPQNRIESFAAKDVKTTTDPTAEQRKRNRTVAVTTSREMLARFDPKTGQMADMKQSGDFVYDEGDRKARAAKATLDSDQNVILLETNARMSDATGSTSADRIRLDERTGDFTAEGSVKSSRLPDKDQKKNSEMLSGDEPLQAMARKMDSRDRNRTIHYEGAVTMWQGANRIQAETVDLDRQKRTLVADKNVVTNLWEEPKEDEKKKAAKSPAAPAPAVLTVVRAAHLVYTEENRLAVYTGGVLLNRPGLQVKGKELRAFLAESGSDSRLEKAFADGAVEILQSSKDADRNGTGDHGEFYTEDQKIVLRAPKAKMVLTPKNGARPSSSEGTELTYLVNDDRLLVTGAPSEPANNRIVRSKSSKKKQE
jgi:lipopolysaccharide export system protein LptA